MCSSDLQRSCNNPACSFKDERENNGFIPARLQVRCVRIHPSATLHPLFFYRRLRASPTSRLLPVPTARSHARRDELAGDGDLLGLDLDLSPILFPNSGEQDDRPPVVADSLYLSLPYLFLPRSLRQGLGIPPSTASTAATTTKHAGTGWWSNRGRPCPCPSTTPPPRIQRLPVAARGERQV